LLADEDPARERLLDRAPLPELGVSLPAAPAAASSLTMDDLHEASAPSLPGLNVVEVVAEEVWPGQRGVRLVHAMDDGRLVELRVAGAAPSAPEAARPPESGVALPPGWTRVTGELRGGWADLRGPLPADELRALLEALATAG
jgi:hypothetical protein